MIKNIEDIKPYDKNAKDHPDSQLVALANIVKEVGWRQPALVNQDNVLVAGHGRLQTYLKYGESHNLKPLWVMDDKGQTVFGAPESEPLTSEQEKVYRLADNKLNESQWNMKLVIEELKDLAPENIDLTGFDRELVLEKDKKTPSTPKETRSQPGDNYRLGEHVLICGSRVLKHADMLVQKYVDITGLTEVEKNGLPELWEVSTDMSSGEIDLSEM